MYVGGEQGRSWWAAENCSSSFLPWGKEEEEEEDPQRPDNSSRAKRNIPYVMINSCEAEDLQAPEGKQKEQWG